MLRLTNAPTQEPISLEQARLHLRVDATGYPPTHPDDSLISGLISAAREQAEEFTGLDIAGRAWEYRIDEFSDEIALPKRPVQEVLGISYYDPDGVLQVVDESIYVLDPGYETDDAPTIMLIDGETWPEIRGNAGDVRIQFTTGFSVVGDSPWYETMPASIQSAMLLIVGSLYDQRSNASEKPLTEIPMGAMALMRPFRRKLGMA